MPLELSVWRIDTGLSRVEPSPMDLENRLEEILARDIGVAAPNWMVIGRQVPTPWVKVIDLLCIDGEGNLVALELKRHRTEREIVAQVLDYGSFVRGIQAEEVPRIYAKYQKDYFPDQPAKSIDEAFRTRFGVKQMPEELDQFMVKNEKGESIPILQAPLKCKDMGHSLGDQDNMEWLVRVKWLKTVPLDKAVRERGLFGNQNCVVEPRDKRWPFTIERLQQHFGIDE